MAYVYTAEEKARMLEGKKKAVLEGRSEVFNNWHQFAGISAAEFIAGLEWLHEDPMTDGKLTRELGCTMPANGGFRKEDLERWGGFPEHAPGVDGLHRLSRHYYADGSFQGFFDEKDCLWGGTYINASINIADRI